MYGLGKVEDCMFRTVVSIALAFGLVQASANHCRAEELDVSGLQQQIYKVVEKTAPAIVEITRRNSVFSGVIVSPQGHILTAGHTVEPGQSCSIVLPDGRRLRGRSLGCCEQMRGDQIDCGLIMVEGANNLPFVEIGSSASLQSNHPCLSISYPGGQRNRREPMVRFGYVNGTARPGRMIRSTALMEPGDSGGPLIDLEGRVIGIHSRITQSISENFDVPIDTYKEFWDQLNVPARFYTQNLKPLPKLGFTGEDYPEKNGIKIISVADGSVAKSLGIQPEDFLLKVHGKNVPRLSDLQNVLQGIVRDKVEEVSVVVQRGEATLDLKFSASKLITPKADRIPGIDNAPATQVKPMPQLAKLPNVVASLESKLDDSCCIVTSSLFGKNFDSMGTMIADSAWIVSKNSMMGSDPSIVSGGKKLSLTVVARDEANDLVLLKSPELNIAGVVLPTEFSTPPRGKFLLSPDPAGSGLTSVVSSTNFQSQRDVSRGYLGVVLEDYQEGGVVLREVNEGAARRAGLQIGDVILQVNQQAIRTRPEILNFLRTVDPNTNIRAKVKRETTEFEAEITLGAPPTDSSHAADMMEKSLRRDGFATVFSHDALVEPNECGGPVFDWDGRFVGINIARHSRVRTFVVPAQQIRKLIDSQPKSSTP